VRAFFCTRTSPWLVCFPLLGFFHSGSGELRAHFKAFSTTIALLLLQAAGCIMRRQLNRACKTTPKQKVQKSVCGVFWFMMRHANVCNLVRGELGRLQLAEVLRMIGGRGSQQMQHNESRKRALLWRRCMRYDSARRRGQHTTCCCMSRWRCSWEVLGSKDSMEVGGWVQIDKQICS
jgi:hypothetical protein